MASNLRVDTILPSTGTSLGIGTASGTTTVTGTLNAASATITGNLGVGGVLTYEDVTNVDSVGVITARNGLRVTGVTTITGTGEYLLQLNKSDSSAVYTQFTNSTSGTSTSDGFRIGMDSNEDGLVWLREDGNVKFGTDNSERLRIGGNGEIGIGGANYGTSGQVLTSQGSGSAVQWATPSSITTAGGTMTLGFQDHVAGAVSSTTPTGYYQRIGNMVFCSADTGAINLSGLNNGQILLVTGCFPVTRDNNWTMAGSAYQYTVNSGQNSGGPVIVPTMGYWLSNTSLYFVIPRNNSTADNMTVGMCNSNNTRIFMQWSYKVN